MTRPHHATHNSPGHFPGWQSDGSDADKTHESPFCIHLFLNFNSSSMIFKLPGHGEQKHPVLSFHQHSLVPSCFPISFTACIRIGSVHLLWPRALHLISQLHPFAPLALFFSLQPTWLLPAFTANSDTTPKRMHHPRLAHCTRS